jgi:hypothetical protein
VFDVNELNRRGHLPIPPADETWIQIRVRDGKGNWQSVIQYIRVDRVPHRPFGGTQPYFVCWCGRRAVKLYRGYGFFRCRQCYRLAYESQQEDAFGRAMRCAAKIKRRLGGDPDFLAPFPPKPWGMWQRTYEGAWYRFLEAEARAEAAFERQAAAIVRRGRAVKTH